MRDPSYVPFRPRPITFRGVRDASGYRIKLYSIVCGDRPFRPDAFEDGLRMSFAVLPGPARCDGRPGVGFAIAHQGRAERYVVLSWWDRENELPTRVFVEGADGWRPASERESFCVWDLEVLWHEREAYVGTVLAEGVADALDLYLDRRLG